MSLATLPPAPIAVPYPGLRPFRFEESPLFFGRGKHITALLKILRNEQFLAVVGSSGSGKSSLVRAGLLPALAEGYLGGPGFDWRFVDLRPGNAPFRNLAQSLLSVAHGSQAAGPDVVVRRQATLRTGPRGLIEAIDDSLLPDNVRILVLVDQFEELFRFAARLRGSQRHDGAHSDEDPLNEAVAFVDQLLWTVNARDPRVYVVLTMRSDFLGDCDAFQQLPQAITRCQFLTPQLTRGELTDAIERALVGRGEIDPAVTSRLLNAIRAPQHTHPAPGAGSEAAGDSLSVAAAAASRPIESSGRHRDVLPLLQHALLRMWTLAERDADEAADGRLPRITLDHYSASGGFEHALSLHASEVYNSLDASVDEVTGQRRRWIAQRMFCSLCQVGGEGRRVRRLATVGQIAAESDSAPDEVITVAEPFLAPGVHFLMATSSETSGRLTPEATLDISHESLIRQWTMLSGWLAAEESSAALYTRLVSSARLHAEGHAETLSEKELAHVEDWLRNRKPNAAWAERYAPNTFGLVRTLIELSRERVKQLEDAAQRREREEAQRKERELEHARRMAEQADQLRAAEKQRADAADQLVETQQSKAAQFKRLTVGIGCALVLAVVLAAWALAATARAHKAEAAALVERDRARTAESTALTERDKAKLAEERIKELEGEARSANENLTKQVDELRAAGSSIIGRDDRVQVMNTEQLPYRAVCQLVVNFKSGGPFLASGVLIGPDAVLTSGHAIFLHSMGGYAAEVTVTPGRNGDVEPFGDLKSIELIVPDKWRSYSDPVHDIGLVILERPIGNETGYLELAALSDKELLTKRVSVVGFPGDKPNGTMWGDAGLIMRTDSMQLSYALDTGGGVAGGPILYSNGEDSVVGIHTTAGSSGKFGTRITNDVLDWIASIKRKPEPPPE